MAANTTAYLPNPAGTENKSVGITLSTLGAGVSTLYTAPASKFVRVRNFTVCLTAVGDGTAEYVYGELKIGTAKFALSLPIPSSGQAYDFQFSSKDLGFDGAWLQSADTITFVFNKDGGTPTAPLGSVAVSLEDFTA